MGNKYQPNGLGSWFHEYDHAYDSYGKKFTVVTDNGQTSIMTVISELTNSFVLEDNSGNRCIKRKAQIKSIEPVMEETA